MDFPWIEIHFENLANPRKKARQLLAAEFIPIAANDNVPGFADVKMRVAKSPDIETFCFAFRRRGLGSGTMREPSDEGSAARRLLECFRRIQTAILRENAEFSKTVRLQAPSTS